VCAYVHSGRHSCFLLTSLCITSTTKCTRDRASCTKDVAERVDSSLFCPNIWCQNEHGFGPTVQEVGASGCGRVEFDSGVAASRPDASRHRWRPPASSSDRVSWQPRRRVVAARRHNCSGYRAHKSKYKNKTIGEPRQSVPGQAKDGATDALMQTSEIIGRAAHCLTTGTKFRVVQHAPDATPSQGGSFGSESFVCITRIG